MKTDIAAEEKAAIKLSVIPQGVFHKEKPYHFTPSQEQRVLEDQLKALAEKSPDVQAFERNARTAAELPARPKGPCDLPERIRQRIRSGESLENIALLFADLIREWYAKGYMITGTQIVPLQLYLRQFYDNFRSLSAGKTRSEVEELQVQTNKDHTNRENTATPAVRVSAEGEADTEQEALRMALQDALSRVGTYWVHKTETSSGDDTSGTTSAYREGTTMITEGTIKSYNKVRTTRSMNGKYRVFINAVVEKSSHERKQQITTFDLTTDYERVRNREKAANMTADLLSRLPLYLFQVTHHGSSPEKNLIWIRGQVSVNLAEYRNWTEKIARFLSWAGQWESSYATDSARLEHFFKETDSWDGIKTSSLFLCDLRQGYGSVPVQGINEADTVYYRKYTLPERLISKIIDSFAVDPVLIVELVDKNNGKKLAGKNIKFSDLGIDFMPRGNHSTVKVMEYGQSQWKSFPVPLLIRPFFYQRNTLESSLHFSFEIRLTLPDKLYDMNPSIKVFALAQQGNTEKYKLHDPTLPTKEQGREKYHAEEFEEAYRIFSVLAQQNSEPDPEINYYLARLANEWQKDPEKAIAYLRSNTDGTSLNYLGDIYRKNNRKPQALECYRKSAQSGNVGGQGRYGLLLLETDPSSGVRYLQKSADAGNLAACFYLGEYFRKNQEPSKAFSYYKKAVDSGKDFSKFSQCLYYTALAYVHGSVTTRNRQTALFYLSRIRPGREKYPEAQYLSGKLLQRAGKRREAANRLRNAARAGHVKGMFEHGSLLLRDDIDQAMRYLESAAEKDKTYYCSIGEELLRRGRNDLAEKMFHLCVKNDPVNKGRALLLLGVLCELRKDWKQADKYYEEAAALGEERALCKLGEKAMRQGDWDKAHSYLVKINNDPNGIMLHGELHEKRSFRAYSLRQALSLYKEAEHLAKAKNDVSTQAEAAGRIRKVQAQLRSMQQ